MSKLTPEESRRLVREQPYANAAAEQEAVLRVDAEAAEAVRRSEAIMRVTASESRENTQALIDVVTEIEEALENEVRFPLLDGAAPGADLTLRYEQLRQFVSTAVADMEMQARRLETLADRLDDPAADYERFARRFPSLLIHW